MLKKTLLRVWHDESHLNRYFIDHKPTTILTPSYCYPESWNLPYPKKLWFFDKNRKEFRCNTGYYYDAIGVKGLIISKQVNIVSMRFK